MYAPAKTPATAINEINKALNNALTNSEVKERFASLGLEVAGGSPADLQKTMYDDTKRWAPIVKKSGFKAD
jgi:tripartite-type tricarboxylate transporter receptor subunit TctC